MAEIKTGIFAKNVQKRLNRAQEKVLQKLGKADETKDEQFEQVVINFRRQESEGSRLQREMKTYMSAIKGMQQASINLTQSLHEVYEPDWHGKDDVMTIGKDCDALWEDFHNKLVDSTLLNLDAYLQQFPDLKTRVAKRSRKLIDYDSARHHVETLQASGMKNDRKIMKAEDELKKAQRVFDELNVGLQDELPTLWDSRVGFYINTYKSVTSLEAKFHREISLVCRQLYEVMTKLAEQHSDKMFTIQGAPSDSGPLRLARTPSPPEDESPPESPDASSNHMLRPVSPGPPRPKSPTQFKKGPPVPPPPKVTPTKEVAEEQIIDLFGGEFLPAPSPSQPNERPGESLLDLDFDAFQPDESVSPIPQTAIPWDMWSANTQTAQPQAADAGFMADWSADFGAVPANGDASSRAEAPEAPAVGLEGAQDGAQGGAQGWPQADGWLPGGNTATPPQESEAATAAESEVSNAFNGFSQDASATSFFANFDKMSKVGSPSSEKPELSEEKMPIPSVVIEPASSNEGDDDRDADIISPTAISDNEVTAQNQTIKHMSPSGAVSGLPDDFLYKVETMHDFEAANSDELELKRGDVVLVVPTASVEDQDAGWLTGIKESDWVTLGAGAQKGLFPENFTQHLE
ncbi:amphiphysin isoform X12 [Trachinotus anak]|uniref:amphiphysin isoform X12 n=1 Tax=Trachinotus anak TaxID=443729 RepID=UPI0039F2016A